MKRFSVLAGPHPHSLSLCDFAPRSGRRRFSRGVGAICLAALAWSTGGWLASTSAN